VRKAAAVHRAQHLDIADRVQPECLRDAIPYNQSSMLEVTGDTITVPDRFWSGGPVPAS
jgi:hypothetical protein